ncbi:MAG: cytochrome c [Saprospiraceae bacterium]|nr:cytochrome c [Saprospiraceae bacterium]
MKIKVMYGIGLLLILAACHTYKGIPTADTTTDWKVQVIPEFPQQLGGDAAKGLQYMMAGDYVGSGIPYELFEKQGKKLAKKTPLSNNFNEDIPYFVNVFEAANGEKVVSGNCFSCHAANINGKVVLGLGNYASDFRNNLSSFGKAIKVLMKVKYGKKSPEWEAYQDFSNFFAATTDAIETHQIGVNPAARLAEACMRQRNPIDLTFNENAYYELEPYNIASDVPPLWNAKKKNALYYTGIGRGDFTKLLMQASVLGSPDSTHARTVQQNFVDVLAWINQLEPPVYPYAIDKALASEGKALFEDHCSKCHGTYGEVETYPNKVVALSVIQTDPIYLNYALTSGITTWYNQSWFATSYPHSELQSYEGYIAPPLDGIWATAPYLHNGAVPTLDDLLNSQQRPTFWQRNISDYDFDEQKVGWHYEVKQNGGNKKTYDTTIPGYGNMGHYFGDKLSPVERKAVIEYLKTL